MDRLPRPYLLALLSGAVSATGFAPLSLWPLTLLAFALLLLLSIEAPTLKSALLRAWVFGVAHFTVGNHWIQHAFTYQDKMPPQLGYLAPALLSLYLAIYPAIAMGLVWRFNRGRRDGKGGMDAATVLIAGAAWIVTEYLRAVIFTGYAWNPLGVIWLPLSGVAQQAAFIGTYALSGLTMVVAGAIALLRYRRWKFPAGTAAVVALLAIGGTALHSPLPQPKPDAPLVRVLQPNIGQETILEGTYAQKALSALIALSNDTPTLLPGGPVPRLIVWPEGTLDYYIEDGYPAAWYGLNDPNRIRGLVAQTLGPKDIALVGTTGLRFKADNSLDAATNSVFTIDPRGHIHNRYDKHHLVPYGEYLPMRSILAPLGLSRLVAGDIDYSAGPGPQTLDIPGFGPIGMQICYEIIFSGQTVDPAKRPVMLFNPSNDAWFGAWGPPQHLAQARLRAIEEGLPILRATPTGISAIIDARGGLVATAPMGEARAIEAAMPLPLPPTLFAKIGNFAAAFTALLLIAAAIVFRRRAR